MYRQPDIIDQEILADLAKPGLIDWTGILARLQTKKINVERRLLHRRCKDLLRSRAREPWIWRE